MKRFLRVFLLVSILTVLLIGTCVGGAVAETEKTRLTIWSMSRADLTYVEPRIKAYNESNPHNIELVLEIYTDNFLQAIDVAAATGGPDIVDLPNTLATFTNYVGNGYYVPIDQFMTEEDKALWGDYAIEGITAFNGEMYYYPVIGTTGRLIYNQDIFDRCGIAAPPQTLSEMVETAKIITDTLSGEGIYGFAANFKSPAGALLRSMDFMIELSGGPNQGFDFAKGEYDFSFYKPFVEAYRTMFTTGIAFPGCESLDIDPLRTLFADGKIGMYISWSHAEPGVYASQFPTQANWNGTTIPVMDGYEKATQSVIGYHGYMITRDCKNPELAWTAIKELFYGKDYLVGYQEAGLGVNMNPAISAKAGTSALLEGKESFLLGPTDVMWPAVPQELNSQAVQVEGENMYNTIFALILGKGDIDSTLADLTERYNAAYEKGIEQGLGTRVQIPGFDPAKPGG
ncbi:MAG: extracellular solute-binding protein [Candidatus Limiplasma sp.]|nr:extracellular solute-binding protein [Candidatus Limiplasma sp.]